MIAPIKLGRFRKTTQEVLPGIYKQSEPKIEGGHMSKRNASAITTASLLAVVALCAGFYAVKPLPEVVGAHTDRREVGAETEQPFGDRLVKGAPFSAQVVIASTQTLANGTHVSSKMTG